MKKNSITDYYFCEECETYHHPNRKINGQYLAACECEVLGQSSQNSNKFQQLYPDSSLFKLSASSQDFRRSKDIFDKSLLSERSLHSAQNLRSLNISPSNAVNRNFTGVIKQKIISQDRSMHQSQPQHINQNKHFNGTYQQSILIPNYPQNQFQRNNQRIQIRARPMLGGRLSPPLTPSKKVPPMAPIIQQPSRQSRIPWPSTQTGQKSSRATSPNNFVGEFTNQRISKFPESIGNRLTATQISNLGRTGRISGGYQDEFSKTFLSSLSPKQKKNVYIENDQPECCGKLCYY